MSRLTINLFGTYQATLGERSVHFPTDKVRALLAFLAVEAARPHRRETLAGLLWPDTPEVTARANLRQTLYRLRTAVGDINNTRPHLLVSTHDIQFNPAGDHTLDAADFERHLGAYHAHCGRGLPLCAICREALKTATALYRGGFMAGFSLPGAPSFELWMLTKQEMFHRQALEGLGRQGEFYEEARDYGRAAECARQMVELEPWRESFHRLLMRNLAQSGQRRAALARYDRCRQLLAEDLGVEPSAATVSLARSISDGAMTQNGRETAWLAAGSGPLPALDRPAASSAPVGLGSRFVGRDNELATLHVHLNAVLAGRGRILFVKGEAGSGKSSLLAQFCVQAMAAQEKLLVTCGGCDARHGLGDPYQPFRELLRQLCGQAGNDPCCPVAGQAAAQRLRAANPLIKRAVLDAGPDLPGVLLPASKESSASRAGIAYKPPPQLALFEQVTGLLRAVAQNRPLIVVLDDLHWIDDASASLLFHLGRRLADSPILVIGAYRPEAVGWLEPDLQGAGRHPLPAVISGLGRIYGDMHIDLDQSDGRAFVESLVDSEPNRLGPAFRTGLYEHTDGNPLFTVEILDGLKNRAELVQDEDGRWTIGQEPDWDHLPPRVEAAIGERIGRLPPSCQAFLTAASIQGQEFYVEIAAALRDADPEEQRDCLSELAGRQHHLVQALSVRRFGRRRVSAYRFRHHLFQRYLYHQLDGVERIALHERTGLALEALYGSTAEQHAGDLARHFEEARRVEKTVNYLRQAGESAYLFSANEAAIAYFRRGLSILAKLPDTMEPEERRRRARLELALQMALGAPLRATGGYASPELSQSYTRARDLARQIGDDDRHFMAQLLIWTANLGRADYRQALAIGQQLHGLAEKTGNGRQMAEANLALGMVRLYSGQFAPALEHLEAVINGSESRQQGLHFSPLGRDIRLAALISSARALWYLGYPDQALRRSQQAIAQTEKMDHPYSLALALALAGCVVHLLRRDYEPLGQLAERLMSIARDEGFDYYTAWARIYQGQAQVSLGETAEGLANLQQGLAVCREIGQRSNMTFGLALLAGAGPDDRDQLEVLQEALELAASTGEQFYEAELHRLRGECLLKRGDEPAAGRCFRQALDIAGDQEAYSLALRAAISLARLERRQGRTREARALLAGALGWFAEGFETLDLREAQALLQEMDGSEPWF